MYKGGISKILMYRPLLLRPDAAAAFAAVSTVRCVRTRAIHRMGSDHRRPVPKGPTFSFLNYSMFCASSISSISSIYTAAHKIDVVVITSDVCL